MSDKLTLQQALEKLSELNPTLCQKSFVSTVFDLFWGEQKIIVSTENQALSQRLYLINAAIEADCQQRGWKIALESFSDDEMWHCCIYIIENYERDYWSEFHSVSHQERHLALLEAYLQALESCHE